MDNEEESKHILLDSQEQFYLQVIEDLNKPRGDGIKIGLSNRLHEDQIKQLRPLYDKSNKVKSLFLSCARKWGKTESIGYVLWKHAIENPGSACYYVCPEAAHGRKIIWDGQRIQKYMGKDTAKYIKTIRDQEMRIKLKNDSFIQVVGSDNYQVANGLTPDIAVYDEFKAFNPRWHVEFAPNRAAKGAPLIIIGTKPRAGNRNTDQYNEIYEYAKQKPDFWYVADRTTWDNPINHLPDQKEIIEQEIAQLQARGEEDVVQLEYYSKVVPGGKRAIFPMLDASAHLYPPAELWKELKNDLKKLEWYYITDPGTTTCFAGLLAAINPYTKIVYILDEIYETDQKMTSVRMMYPRMEAQMLSYYPNSSIHDDYIKVADEAAAWFMNEVMQQYGIYFMPTDKVHNRKDQGLSLIKDQLIHNVVKISKNCTNLWKEMEKYALDDKGNIPKRHDHLIDCFRYLNAASHYSMVEVLEAIKNKQDPMERRRFRNLEHDVEKEPDDWTEGIFIDFD